MYKIPHAELMNYFNYVKIVYETTVDNHPLATLEFKKETDLALRLSELLFQHRFESNKLIVDDGKQIYPVHLCINIDGAFCFAQVGRSQLVEYDVERHSFWQVDQAEYDRVYAIHSGVAFTHGAARFRPFDGNNSLILMGLDNDIVTVVFTAMTTQGTPTRYIAKFDSLCILNKAYERIPFNRVTEAQIIHALEQILNDESGLVEVHSPKIYTVRCNVEINDIELYRGEPIPTAD